MKLANILFGTLVLGSLLVAPAIASADEADKAACADLDEGDDCTRGDGGPGTCIPDESDPDVLTCDDDSSSSSTGSGGSDDGSSSSASCSAAAPSSGSAAFGALGLLGLVSVARRARAKSR